MVLSASCQLLPLLVLVETAVVVYSVVEAVVYVVESVLPPEKTKNNCFDFLPFVNS